MTEMSEQFGVTRNVLGKWLKAIGLRKSDGTPSDDAFRGRFVTQSESTNPGTYYYTWHEGRTIEALEKAGYKRSDIPKKADSVTYAVRQSGRVGLKVVDAKTEIVVAWSTDPRAAHEIATHFTEIGFVVTTKEAL